MSRHPFTRAWQRSAMPRYVGVAVLAAAAGLVAFLIWQGAQYVLHPELRTPPTAQSRTSALASDPPAPWEGEILTSINTAIQDAGAGKMVAAEMDVDRASAVATTMRIESRPAQPAFFALSLDGLDHVLAQHPGDDRMMDHVTQARVALAELRSSMNSAAAPAPAAASTSGPALDVAHASTQPAGKPVSLGAPRELGPDTVLDPATLGSNAIDATLMPEDSEILLPPASRSFADGVRVENLTISGAAQTLDGVHWRNVTFIGTRLRYEGGALDLRDVRFVNCRFGFPSDDHGARLADAIALGRSSITIDAPTPAPASESAPSPASPTP